jgi:site-specific recombinase
LRWRRHGRWDLTALLNAAQAQNSGPEQRLWLIRLAEWLRGDGQNTVSDDGSAPASSTPSATPWPVRRLRHLVNLLERHPEHARAVRHLLQQVLRECDLTALLADAGFAPRAAFTSELGERLRSIRALFTQHYSMLARKVAERSAETGEHYITRTRRRIPRDAAQRRWRRRRDGGDHLRGQVPDAGAWAAAVLGRLLGGGPELCRPALCWCSGCTSRWPPNSRP